MDSWYATFLGRRHLLRELSAFEVEVFFIQLPTRGGSGHRGAQTARGEAGVGAADRIPSHERALARGYKNRSAGADVVTR